MYDSADHPPSRISHDRPCARCGHPMHTYLACSETCRCQPAGLRRTALAGR